ncbi:MAG: 3-keto-5-aminohexanoate cleavage protein [Halofilum sp. (in: g-proteobacteria)]
MTVRSGHPGTAPLAVTVAPNGARRSRADHPALPITPDELAATAAACADAGAAMFHLHVRDASGRHSLDPDRYRAAMDAIRERTADRLILQVTTEAAGRYTPAEQMALVRELRPEAVSMAVRELVPDSATEDEAAAFFAWLADEPILPQFIVYSPEDLHRFLRLRERGVITGTRASLLFVLGRYDARDAEPRELIPFLATEDGTIPWTACAFGRHEYACCAAAAALGGHVRVGFENNLLLKDGRRAPDNAALVHQVRELAQALGRPLADPGHVRALHGP